MYINLCHLKQRGVMKKRDLEKFLKEMGFWLLREGGNHEIWTNGVATIPIPRHKEVNESLAKAIMRGAQKAKIKD